MTGNGTVWSNNTLQNITSPGSIGPNVNDYAPSVAYNSETLKWLLSFYRKLNQSIDNRDIMTAQSNDGITWNNATFVTQNDYSNIFAEVIPFEYGFLLGWQSNDPLEKPEETGSDILFTIVNSSSPCPNITYCGFGVSPLPTLCLPPIPPTFLPPSGSIVVYTYITISGNLSLPTSSSLQINPGASLNITGCASLGGTLILNVSGLAIDGKGAHQISPIYAACFVNNNTFNNVTFEGLSNCESPQNIFQKIEGNQLAVIFFINSSCGSSISAGGIIGISVAGAVIVLITVLIVIFLQSRKKVKKGRKIKNMNTVAAQQQ